MKILLFILSFIIIISSNLYSNDSDISVIKKYYKYLENEKLIRKAYDMSSTKATYEKFYSWYKNVDKIELVDIIKINKNEYKFQVIIKQNIPFADIYVFEVEMKIKNGKIIQSKSKPCYEYKYYEYHISNSKVMEVISNLKEKKYFLHFFDNGNLILNIPYQHVSDKTEVKFEFYDLIGNYLIIKLTGFELLTYHFFDIINKKKIITKFSNIYISEDKNIIFTYSCYDYEDGLNIEFFNNKYVSLEITNKGVQNPKLEFNDNIYWLTYNEIDIYNKTEIIKKLNLSDLF